MLHDFVLHEAVTCNESGPRWIDNSIRFLIQDENEAYNRFKSSNYNSQRFKNFQSLQRLLELSIRAFKQRYYSLLSKNQWIHR